MPEHFNLNLDDEEVAKILGPEHAARNNAGTQRASRYIAGQIFTHDRSDLVLDSGSLGPSEGPTRSSPLRRRKRTRLFTACRAVWVGRGANRGLTQTSRQAAHIRQATPGAERLSTRRIQIGSESDHAREVRLDKAQRDVVALGIAFAAIIMFVALGGSVLSQVVQSVFFAGVGPDRLLSSALLLNIALVIFGWRRHRELTDEVSERRKAEAQARELAETDPLTGCLNRRSIGPATDRLIAEASQRGEAVAFVMVDLDSFKQINDLNGHSVGDIVLRECATRMRTLLPQRALIARLGGDEFACVLPFDERRSEHVDRLATAIIEKIARPIVSDLAGQVETSVSLGLSRSDMEPSRGDRAVDAGVLLHMADIAMYHAKKQGKNRYFWFERTMESDLRLRSELEAGIRRGIAVGEFVPYYEQQIDLVSGELVGFEMLARWNAPGRGVVGPDVFIPIAEELGVISALSESVIAQALQDAKAWDPKLTLAVNISPIQLRDPWFAQKLLKLLVEANFPPERLDVEITESCLHENVPVVRSLIASLRNQGIRVSLDDFGTGYSSLAQLRSLPFDQIKIDRSFVTNLIESADSETIVKAITSLGEGLGMPVTAEGVETADVLERLKGYGKYKGQGYLYGRPQPAAVTAELLAQRDLLAVLNAKPDLPAAAEMSVKRSA